MSCHFLSVECSSDEIALKSSNLDISLCLRYPIQMTYTIKINDSSEKSRSIIKMLKELSKDYSFLEIYEDSPALSEKIEIELDKRLKFVENNPELGKNWQDIKASLLK